MVKKKEHWVVTGTAEGLLDKMEKEEQLMEDEKYIICEAMEKYGGSFVKALGKALRAADPNNTRRIKKAFPDYWEQYLKMGKTMVKK